MHVNSNNTADLKAAQRSHRRCLTYQEINHERGIGPKSKFENND